MFVENKATLIDMSEGFKLDFYPKQKGDLISMHLQCKEHISTDDDVSVSLNYTCIIDQNVFENIVENFNNFPKWW
jgi:hypothetical protein